MANKEAEQEVETTADAKPARFIRGENVVDVDGKVVEGLSVKDGSITGTEKASK